MKNILYLPRQTTIYTCGAACLAAVSRLRDGNDDEITLAQGMKARPFVGISNQALWDTAKKMGAETYGEGIWDGKKCAILNILNPISGVGHYVVALRMENNGDVIVYCPYYANTLKLTKKWLIDHWISGDSVFRRWSIVFPFAVPDETVCVGEEWPEMGLGAGEPNPHWLLRSANRFLSNAKII